jgi:hypothetical protein
MLAFWTISSIIGIALSLFLIYVGIMEHNKKYIWDGVFFLAISPLTGIVLPIVLIVAFLMSKNK